MTIKLTKFHFILISIVLGLLAIQYFEKYIGKRYLLCETTLSHDKIISENNLESKIPQKFTLVLDKYSVYLYPTVEWKNERQLMSFKTFKDNLSKTPPIYVLEHDGYSNDLYMLTQMASLVKRDKFPYRVLSLSASSLDLSVLDRKKNTKRYFTVIANCKTWSMAVGKGGKRQI